MNVGWSLSPQKAVNRFAKSGLPNWMRLVPGWLTPGSCGTNVLKNSRNFLMIQNNKMKNHLTINEVFIEQTSNASAEKVFNAWTDPEKLMKWYAPDGCTVLFKKIKVETGGEFH